MMHRHTQNVSEETLAIVVLMLSSRKGAQNRGTQCLGDGKCHLLKEVHKA